MLTWAMKKIFGTSHERAIRRMKPRVEAIGRMEPELKKLTDEQLFEPTKDPRNRRTGQGVTRYVLLHGLVQHHAYHSGQIAILAKL